MESFSRPKPMSSYVTPPQIQTLYGLSSMYSGGTRGQGRTIAISSWDGYRLSNVPFEYSEFSLPTPAGGVGSNITVKTIDGGSGAGTEQGEADLDIQSILGVAPLCNLVIYDGSGGDLINVLTRETNDNSADIISESYGWNISPSTATAAHNLHLSMTAQGITYMAASGDSGTTLSYYYPDIEPEVLLVGGTTCSVDSSGNRISETGWSGSGGGWKATSDSFNKLPAYQVGTGVPTSINYRLLPDVALDADPNSGYVVYLNNNYYIIGGTSGASPTCAGSLADSEQQLIANGAIAADGSGHYRLGRIQDTLYAMNGDSSVFYDVTSGSNGQLPSGATGSATTGWDFVTGWGAIKFDGLVNALSGSGLTQFTVTPTSVVGGTAVTGKVTTATAAPSGGTVVTISGGDSSVHYTSSVTIPSGAKSATFSITTSAVSSNDTESLTATLNSATKTATVLLTPSTLSSIAFKPASGAGGNSFTGTVTLAQAAASSGDVVSLSGGDSSVSFPSSVTVPGGAKTVTFTVTSNLVSSSDVETITATLGSVTKSATITLAPLTVSSLTLSPASVLGGATVTGTVTLSGTVGPAGVTVTLSGGDGSVSYPSTVTVAANAKTATFHVTTTPVSSSDSESITATFGPSTKTGSFTINAPALSSLAFSPNSVFGGVSSTGTVTISGVAASSGVTVALSGGNSSVSYPSTVTVPSGAKTVTFTVTTSVVATSTTNTLTASLNSVNKSANLVVKPAGVVSAVSFSPASVVGGNTSTGTVKLTGGAGPLGVTVNLSGGDGSISYPSTVSIAAGVSSATFSVTSSTVSANTSEVITATLGPSSAHGTLTVTAPTVSSLTFSPTSVTGGTSSTGTVTLSSVAGPSGEVITLSGGDSYVHYTTTLTIAAGATTGTFTVTTSMPTKSTAEKITAKLGTSSKVATLTVHP